MRKIKPGTAIVYVGHIPFGLFEPQLREYFSQFGRILRVKVSRSKKNGHSRGYGFIEFDSLETAQIAASTMNNYIIFKRSLKCHVIPKENIHPFIFNRSKRNISSSEKTSSKKDVDFNKKRSNSIRKKKLLRINEVLKRENIEYDLPRIN